MEALTAIRSFAVHAAPSSTGDIDELQVVDHRHQVVARNQRHPVVVDVQGKASGGVDVFESQIREVPAAPHGRLEMNAALASQSAVAKGDIAKATGHL